MSRCEAGLGANRDGKSADERDFDSLALRLVRHQPARGPEVAQGKEPSTTRPGASIGRSRNHASRRSAICSSDSPTWRRRRFWRISAMPSSASCNASRKRSEDAESDIFPFYRPGKCALVDEALPHHHAGVAPVRSLGNQPTHMRVSAQVSARCSAPTARRYGDGDRSTESAHVGGGSDPVDSTRLSASRVRSTDSRGRSPARPRRSGSHRMARPTPPSGRTSGGPASSPHWSSRPR